MKSSSSSQPKHFRAISPHCLNTLFLSSCTSSLNFPLRGSMYVETHCVRLLFMRLYFVNLLDAFQTHAMRLYKSSSSPSSSSSSPSSSSNSSSVLMTLSNPSISMSSANVTESFDLSIFFFISSSSGVSSFLA